MGKLYRQPATFIIAIFMQDIIFEKRLINGSFTLTKNIMPEQQISLNNTLFTDINAPLTVKTNILNLLC